MGEQAEALGCSVSMISSIETGRTFPSGDYIDHLCIWLELDPNRSAELKRRIPRSENVIAFPRKPDATRTVRMFRKLSKMTPAQIRALGDELPRGTPDD
jgi:transcriptional regulator with XRE-family HTH domain